MFSAEICALGTQNNVVNVSRSIAVGRGNGINDKLLSFYVVICEKKGLSLVRGHSHITSAAITRQGQSEC